MPVPSLALRAMFKILKLFKLFFFLSSFLSLLFPFFGQGGGAIAPFAPLGSALVMSFID